jgi:hypothetical protein
MCTFASLQVSQMEQQKYADLIKHFTAYANHQSDVIGPLHPTLSYWNLSPCWPTSASFNIAKRAYSY